MYVCMQNTKKKLKKYRSNNLILLLRMYTFLLIIKVKMNTAKLLLSIRKWTWRNKILENIYK